MDSNKLLSYMPDDYIKSKLVAEFNKAHASELTLIENKLVTIKNNYYINTADEKTITRWENILKIKILPNEELEHRRKRVNAYLNAMANFSKTMIQELAGTYIRGEIEPIFDLKNFKIIINVTSNVGIPYAFEYFLELLDDIKPAFIEINFKLESNTKDTIKFGVGMVTGEEIRVYPYQIQEISTKGKIKMAISQSNLVETVSILPKGDNN